MGLLSVNADAKTSKGAKLGYLTGILYLVPHTISGLGNLCANASPGCAAACLFTAGRGRMSNVWKGRQRKTELFINHRADFMAELVRDIEALVRKADRDGLVPAVRLNGTSDIPWENVKCGDHTNIMARFPSVQFYDYTKNPNRTNLPDNYDITFSLSECNDADAEAVLARGINVAAVFHDLPESFMGAPVIDGDESDLRFLDERGVIVGLIAKGDAKKDESGFVR